ncbi:MAG: hypothetical protein KDB27_31295 [Planctomycetales bacterium]|nr:hypothetical protein [Planctomycetales bacterium]
MVVRRIQSGEGQAFWRKSRSAARDIAPQTASNPTLRLGFSGRRTPAVEYRIAQSRLEYQQAFRLVYRNYRRANLIPNNEFGFRVTQHQLLPTSRVFVAVLRNAIQHEVLSTISLISDGVHGLPSDICYQPELNMLRNSGCRIAEVSCLAFAPSRASQFGVPSFRSVFMQLIRLLAHYARASGIDTLVIATHPRHHRFYRRTMGFQQFGGETIYPSVEYKPVVASYLKFQNARRARRMFYEAIFGGPDVPDWQLRSDPISHTDYEYFSVGMSQHALPLPLLVAPYVNERIVENVARQNGIR